MRHDGTAVHDAPHCRRKKVPSGAPPTSGNRAVPSPHAEWEQDHAGLGRPFEAYPQGGRAWQRGYGRADGSRHDRVTGALFRPWPVIVGGRVLVAWRGGPTEMVSTTIGVAETSRRPSAITVTVDAGDKFTLAARSRRDAPAGIVRWSCLRQPAPLPPTAADRRVRLDFDGNRPVDLSRPLQQSGTAWVEFNGTASGVTLLVSGKAVASMNVLGVE